MPTFYTILTAVGEAKIANAQALGETVNLTAIAVGDGNGNVPNPDRTNTALVHEVRRAPVNLVDIDSANPGQIIIEQVIPENIGGFWVREVGLFDEDGSLIAIGNCPPTYKPVIAEGSGRTQTIRMVLIVSSTAAVQLKIDPAIVLATRKYADDAITASMTAHNAAADPHPQYTTQQELNAAVSAAITAIVNASPASLDTLKELADALGNDANFSATVLNALALKAPLSRTGDASSIMFRNRIINGDMRIDQRNAGLASAASGLHHLDRWYVRRSGGAATANVEQSNVAPAGFKKSLLLSITNGAAPAPTDSNYIYQIIEGFNIADLGFGAAGALPVTLQFIVRASIPGTYGGCLTNGATTRGYPFTFTVNAANTFETKTVTIPGDVAGVWASDNTAGMYLYFDYGSGSNANGIAGAWATTSGAKSRVAGSVNLAATTGATLYITGVQLEAGETASPFERRPFPTELALCERYYQKSYSYPNKPGSTIDPFHIHHDFGVVSASTGFNFMFRTPFRSVPAMTVYSPTTGNPGAFTSSSGEATLQMRFVGQNGLQFYQNSVSSGFMSIHYTADAEL